MRLALAREVLQGFFVVVLSASPGLAYRPFVSTDAAVADVKEMEIELGYFNWARDRGKSTFIVPQTVLNYGLVKNLELVGEFSVGSASTWFRAVGRSCAVLEERS
jgi:hypothetical protein